MRRPRFHGIITTQSTAATTTGTYPPSTNLKRLVTKNGTSNDRKSTRSETDFHIGQRHVVRVTSKKMIDVMAIVPVTAIPYADARRAECWNVRTSAMHATASTTLTSGTKICPSADCDVCVTFTRGR